MRHAHGLSASELWLLVRLARRLRRGRRAWLWWSCENGWQVL